MNKIFPMDCVAGMRELLEDESVDVIVTSPPYNIDINYHTYRDNLSEEEYLDWFTAAAKELRRVLRDDGSFFLNVGGKPSDPLWPLKIATRVGTLFALQNTIHWIKSIAVSRRDAGNYPHVLQDFSAGHYKPVNSSAYLNGCHEYIFHFTRHGGVPLDKQAVGVEYQDKTNRARWKSARELRDRGNTWFIPYETIRLARPHPSTFPARLPEMCLQLHGLGKVRLCLDPFMGIGTTAVACTRLEVNFVGFEIDPAYVEIAEERIAQERARLGGRMEKLTEAKETNAAGGLFRLVIEQLPPAEMEPLFQQAVGEGPVPAFIRKLERQYSPREQLLIMMQKDLAALKRLAATREGHSIRKQLDPLLKRLKQLSEMLEGTQSEGIQGRLPLDD